MTLAEPALPRARGFAPGHVTGVFAPARSGVDPRARGSIGAGIVLDEGAVAEAEWRPNGRDSVRVRDTRGRSLTISEEVARRLWARRKGALEVRVHHALPVGQGFGMSAAGSLATARAVGRLARRPLQRTAEVAHLAELFGGGGLGGVSAILEGGLETRLRPGVPPFGRVVHRPFPWPVFLIVAGRPIPSPRMLSDSGFLDRAADASANLLEGRSSGISPLEFLRASEEFTDRVRVAPPALQKLIRSLRSPDVRVAQAMIGRSLFAVPTSRAGRRRLLRSLTRARLRALEMPAMALGSGAAVSSAGQGLLGVPRSAASS